MKYISTVISVALLATMGLSGPRGKGSRVPMLETPIPTPTSSPTPYPTSEVSSLNSKESYKYVESFVAKEIRIPKISSSYFNVQQQPGGSPNFVSEVKDTFTQYHNACRGFENGKLDLEHDPNCYSLLIHNTTEPGSDLDLLAIGDSIFLENEANQTIEYRVSQIDRFRLIPKSSKYLNLDPNAAGEELTALELFTRMHQNTTLVPKVVVQTCISIDGNDSAGRLFITATPVEEIRYLSEED